MTEQQARQILMRYRPGSPAADEPDIIEALALVRQSPELQAWFDRHCAMQTAIRAGLKRTAAPRGLKEQILSERKAQTSFWPKTRASRLTAVAAVAVILILAANWLKPYLDRPDDQGMDFYRTQVLATALRVYRMDVETNSLPAVRSYLTQRQANADWVLPKSLEDTLLLGCGVIHWQDRSVSMICFRTTPPVRGGPSTDLFLFVVDRSTIHPAPAAGEQELAQVGDLATVSWSVGDKIYTLAVRGDEATLKSFL